MLKALILIITFTLFLNTSLYSQYYYQINEHQKIYEINKVKVVNEYSTKNGKVLKIQRVVNKKGLIESIINYDLSGTYLNKTVYDYSNKNQVIESILDKSGRKESETVFYLNSNGKVVKCVSEDDITTFEYNNINNTIFEYYLQGDGGSYEFFYQFNESGLLLEESSKFGVTKHIYNNENLLIQTLYYDSFNNNALSLEIQYTYSDNKLMSKRKETSLFDNQEDVEEYLFEYEFYNN